MWGKLYMYHHIALKMEKISKRINQKKTLDPVNLASFCLSHRYRYKKNTPLLSYPFTRCLAQSQFSTQKKSQKVDKFILWPFSSLFFLIHNTSWSWIADVPMQDSIVVWFSIRCCSSAPPCWFHGDEALLISQLSLITLLSQQNCWCVMYLMFIKLSWHLHWDWPYYIPIVFFRPVIAVSMRHHYTDCSYHSFKIQYRHRRLQHAHSPLLLPFSFDSPISKTQIFTNDSHICYW